MTLPLTLKARYVFPVEADPIADGSLTICDGTITAVGRGLAEGEYRDLGNVAILPGLVNAHTHLEFSDLAEPLGTPGMGFVDWIEAVIAYRRQRRQPARDAVAKGLDECLRLGTTALGEIAQPDWSQEPFVNASIDATVFLELIALSSSRAGEVLALAEQHVQLGGQATTWRAGISPHAPYTVDLSLVRNVAAISARTRTPVAFHLAESKEEIERATRQSGLLCEFLARKVGVQTREVSKSSEVLTPATLPTCADWIVALRRASRALVIHGNYLDDDAIAELTAAADRMSVVYCPRTHAYFGHDPYPLEKMLGAGVRVALGTDGRASSPDLSVLAEMRLAARRHPSVPGNVILRMGTLHGAAALGRADQLGSLRPEKNADLAIVRLPDRDAADPHDLLFDSNDPVIAAWIRGREMKDEG